MQVHVNVYRYTLRVNSIINILRSVAFLVSRGRSLNNKFSETFLTVHVQTSA